MGLDYIVVLIWPFDVREEVVDYLRVVCFRWLLMCIKGIEEEIR